MIRGVSQVVFEVEDQDRALELWTSTMRFEPIQDAAYGERRWLELRTPDEAVVIVLSLRDGERPTAPCDVASLERLLLLRRVAPNVRGAACSRSRISSAAHRAALRLVVDVRGSGGQPLRADAGGGRRGRPVRCP